VLFVFSIGPSHNQDIELNIRNKRPFACYHLPCFSFVLRFLELEGVQCLERFLSMMDYQVAES